MSTSLYQKYRPQTFGDLIGQEHVSTTILNELKHNAVSHAYLFSGPRGIGKTSIARLLARAVNCLEPKDGEPCNACKHCTLITSGQTLDIVEIDAASHTGVDNVRENIIENARVSPSILKWKVFIIDEIHMLSTSAFNALLKTIEEPPRNTLFILATTELHKVPETIISRCERFNFRRLTIDQIRERLTRLVHKEGIRVDDEVLDAIAKRAEGALRDAESLLGQVLTLDDTHITREMADLVLPHSDIDQIVELWKEIVANQAALAFTRLSRLLDEGIILSQFSKDLIEFLRRTLLYRVQNTIEPLEYLDLSAAQMKEVIAIVAQLSPQRISKMITVCMEAQQQLRYAAIPQLPLELAIVSLIDSTPAQNIPEQPVVEPIGDTAADEELVYEPIDPEAEVADATAEESAKKQTIAEEPPHEATHLQPVGMASVIAAETSATVQEVAPEVPEAVENLPTTTLTFDYIQKHWGTILVKLKEANHALHLTFQVGKLVSSDNNTITVGFQYQFYQDRINDARNRVVIDEVFEDVFKQRCILNTVVGDEYAMATPNSNHENIGQPSEEEIANVWDLAASSFGTHTQEA